MSNVKLKLGTNAVVIDIRRWGVFDGQWLVSRHATQRGAEAHASELQPRTFRPVTVKRV